MDVAVDARLVKSASRPLSQQELKKQREHRQAEDGSRDKNGKPLKFARDLESDWTVRNDTPHFGLKEHSAVDAKHGFVLATTLIKIKSDAWFRQAAFNVARGMRILSRMNA